MTQARSCTLSTCWNAYRNAIQYGSRSGLEEVLLDTTEVWTCMESGCGVLPAPPTFRLAFLHMSLMRSVKVSSSNLFLV